MTYVTSLYALVISDNPAHQYPAPVRRAPYVCTYRHTVHCCRVHLGFVPSFCTCALWCCVTGDRVFGFNVQLT